MEEQSKQLDEVKQDVAIFLFHPDNVWQGKGPVCVDSSVSRRGPGEETKLEKVLHYDCKLGQKKETNPNRLLAY